MARPNRDMEFFSVMIPKSWRKRMQRIKDDLGILKSQVAREGILARMIELEKKLKKKKD